MRKMKVGNFKDTKVKEGRCEYVIWNPETKCLSRCDEPAHRWQDIAHPRATYSLCAEHGAFVADAHAPVKEEADGNF